jgi:hypothetical protein
MSWLVQVRASYRGTVCGEGVCERHVPAFLLSPVPNIRRPRHRPAHAAFPLRHSFNRLCMEQRSFHSFSHACLPRRMKRSHPRPTLICPNTGSAVWPRFLYRARPRLAATSAPSALGGSAAWGSVLVGKAAPAAPGVVFGLCPRQSTASALPDRLPSGWPRCQSRHPPGRSRWAAGTRLCAAVPAPLLTSLYPVPHRVGSEFGAVIRTNMRGDSAVDKELGQAEEHIVRPQTARNLNRQTLSSVLHRRWSTA